MVKFERGVAVLTLAQLALTVRYTDAKGNLPLNRPVEHFKVIEDVCKLIQDKTGLTPGIKEIFASEAQSMQVMWKGPQEECPLENYLFQRIVTVVEIPAGIEDTATNYAGGVAISYCERGITIGFGLKVKVCSNMTIWGDYTLCTFSDQSVTYEAMLKVLESWLEGYQDTYKDWMNKVVKLQSIKVTVPDADMMLGSLLRAAVMYNEGGHDNYGVNVTQVTKVAKQVGKLLNEAREFSITGWDITNACTDVLKADTSDMVKLFQDNRKVVNFLWHRIVTERVGEVTDVEFEEDTQLAGTSDAEEERRDEFADDNQQTDTVTN